MREKLLIKRDQERGSLARAGLGLPGDVQAAQRNGQGLGLDGGAVNESGVTDSGLDLGLEV